MDGWAITKQLVLWAELCERGLFQAQGKSNSLRQVLRDYRAGKFFVRAGDVVIATEYKVGSW